MVVYKDIDGKSLFNISDKLNRFLLRCKYKIEKEDTQVIGILFGGVGCGKSVFAQKIMHVINPISNNLDKIAFDKMEFINAVIKSNKEVIIADEGISMFHSRAVMSKEGRLMAELMAQIRQKNLFVLILLPNVLSVDSLILDQASFIGHVYERRKKTESGKIEIYKGGVDIYPDLRNFSYKDRMIRWLKLRRANPMFKEKKPPFFIRQDGDIYNENLKPFYAVNKEDYLKKKVSVFDKYIKVFENEKNNKIKAGRERNWDLIDTDLNSNMKIAEISVKYNLSHTTISKRRQQLKALANKNIVA